MIDPHKYAQGVVSVQIEMKHNRGHGKILVQDPERPEGWSWVGGFLRPSGSFREIVEELAGYQTGARIYPESIVLREIVYSRSAVNDRWIANHCFEAEASPLESWSPPGNPDFKVALFGTRSFSNWPGNPEKILDINGKTTEKFSWAINDGKYLGWSLTQRAENRDLKERISLPDGGDFGIYTAEVPQIGNERDMPPGPALNVGSVIIPYIHKGKHGTVLIKNRDSPYYAHIGGKVEVLSDSRSRNLDVLSCIVKEAEEETGLGLIGRSIVGTAVTPMNSVMTVGEQPCTSAELGDLTSVINTCIQASPVNPMQLEEALNNPENAIPPQERGKIEGIYFVPTEEYVDIVKANQMRTRDMAPLARLRMNNLAGSSLELIQTLPPSAYSAGFSKTVRGLETTIPE